MSEMSNWPEDDGFSPGVLAAFLTENAADLDDESAPLREQAARMAEDLQRAERGLAWLAGVVAGETVADPERVATGVAYIVEQLQAGVALDDELAAVLVEARGLLDCRACGEVEPVIRWQVAQNGARHLRAECPRCGRWIKFVPQSPQWRERVVTS